MANSNLPAVIETAARSQGLALANVNLIMPTETFGAVLGKFDKITIETVQVNANDSRETYEPNGEGKGFALGKVPLQSIASALSIQWHPQFTGIVESTKTKSRAKAVGVMRKPNGETITQTEEKTIDLEVEEDDLREKAEKNAEGGRIVDWEKTANGKNRPVKVPWKSDEERQEFIEREIKKSIKQKRRFKDELAMTGAKDRVIRAFLALKSTYTAAELSKPLAFPRVTTDTSKMLEDPAMRKAAIGLITQASANLYGPQSSKSDGIDTSSAISLDEAAKDAEDDDPPMVQAEKIAVDALDAGFDDDQPTKTDREADARRDAITALEEYVASGLLTGKKLAQVNAAIKDDGTPLVTLQDYVAKCRALSSAEAKAS